MELDTLDMLDFSNAETKSGTVNGVTVHENRTANALKDTRNKDKSFISKLGNMLVQDERNDTISGAKANLSTWEDIPGLSTRAYDAYTKAADRLNQGEWFHEREPFGYDKDISDFMNPNDSTIVNKAGTDVRRAKPLRGGYGLDVDKATSMENAYNELWNEAKNDWAAGRDYEHLAQSRLDHEKAQARGNLDVMKQLADWENERNNQYMSTIAEYQKAMAETPANNNLTRAGNNHQPHDEDLTWAEHR